MKAITVGSFRFSPTRWPTLAALVFIILTIWLGQWQTRRGDEKQTIQDRLDGLAHAPVVSLPPRTVVAEEFAQRKIEVRGEYLNEKTIFIDNRVYRSRPGYHVITPLRISGGDLLVAVNRGWIAADPRRVNLPRVPGPAGVQTVQGIAVRPLDRVYELSHENVTGPVKQNLALDRLRLEWGMALQPVVLQQTNDTADGLIRDWPRPDAGTDTHRAYALQWYVMAAVGFILWIALNLRKIRDNE
jgi:surfeit locus 1 family protein